MNAFRLSAAVLLSCVACERRQPIEMLQPPPGQQQTSLQKHWALPDFALTERSGQKLRLGDLAGKVWVADFFYTTCPGPCPMMSSRLSEIHRALAREDRVRLVSISTHPEKDTPDVLKAYAERFKADDRWLFLTGGKQDIHTLANDGFKLGLSEDPSAEDPISHSTKLVLVDQAGVVRGFYDGIGEGGVPQILQDIRRLLAE